MQAVQRDQHAGLLQRLVVFHHRRHGVRRRHGAGCGRLIALRDHQHHESHHLSPFGFCIPASLAPALVIKTNEVLGIDIPVEIISEVIACVRLPPLRYETAVAIFGPEIDIDAAHPVAGKDEFGVAKAFPVLGHALIGDEGGIAIDKNPLEVLPLDPAGIPPAFREIGRLVDAVVERTGEAEILGQGILDTLAIVGAVSGKNAADQVGFAFLRSLRHSGRCFLRENWK